MITIYEKRKQYELAFTCPIKKACLYKISRRRNAASLHEVVNEQNPTALRVSKLVTERNVYKVQHDIWRAKLNSLVSSIFTTARPTPLLIILVAWQVVTALL